MPKLTKALIDSAAPNGKHQWIMDSEVVGFGVRVTPHGRKTYIIRYRTNDAARRQRKMNLCRCDVLSPAEARAQARKVLAQVAMGGDPVEERRHWRATPTIEALSQRYLEEHARPYKKPRSVQSDESNLNLYILPALADKKTVDVTRQDVKRLHTQLADKPATANQVLALLSKMFSLAEEWEARPANTNPTTGIKKYKLRKRELILTQEQISTLHRAMGTMVEEGGLAPQIADLVRLLMLTGCRLREIMDARLEWVDRERSLLLLEDSKVGERKIPLSPAAMQIIQGMPEGQAWVIPNLRGDGPLSDPYKAWTRIKARAGIPAELRLHDLRHTAGSLAHMAGMSQKQIADMLGHKQLSTTERYLHGTAEGKVSAVQTLGNVITGAWGKHQAA